MLKAFLMVNPLRRIPSRVKMWDALGQGGWRRRSWIPILVLAALLAGPWAVEAQSEPTAPGNLTATFVAGKGVVLSWNAPAKDAGSVTGYQILRKLKSQEEPRATVYVADTGSTDTTYTDSDVTVAGEQYNYRVKALRGDDVSKRSNLGKVVIPDAPPADLTATAVEGVGVVLTWSAPAQDSDSVTGYRILRRLPQQGEPNPTVYVADTGSTETTYTDADATVAGEQYSYRVKALRGNVASKMSNLGRVSLPQPSPEPTTTPGLTVHLGDITNLEEASFISGSLDGATDAVNRYTFTLGGPKMVELDLQEQETNGDMVLVDGEGNNVAASRNAGTADEEIAVSLLAGDYEARVEAQEAGASEYSFHYGVSDPGTYSVAQLEQLEANLPVLSQEQAKSADLAPSGLQAEVLTEGVHLYWEVPVADEGTVTSYVIKRTELDGGTTPRAGTELDTGSRDLSYTDSAANEEGVTYSYQVRAVRDESYSEWSEPVTVTYTRALLGPPTAPSVLSVTRRDDGGLRFEWNPPREDDESVTGYGLVWNQGWHNEFRIVNWNNNPKTLRLESTATVYEPTSGAGSPGWGMWGKYYRFSVKAVRGEAVSPESNPVTMRMVPQMQELLENDDYAADTSTTGRVTVGGMTSGNIEIGGDRDWIAIELVADTQYFIHLTRALEKGALFDPELVSVYDSEGRSISGTMDLNSGWYLESFLSFTPADSGTYYIGVSGRIGYNGRNCTWTGVDAKYCKGSYDLSVREVQLPEITAGDIGARRQTARAINVGEQQASTIQLKLPSNTAGWSGDDWSDYWLDRYSPDHDWWRVNLQAGRSYAIDMKGRSTGHGTLANPLLWRLRDSAGTPINDLEIYEDVGEIIPSTWRCKKGTEFGEVDCGGKLPWGHDPKFTNYNSRIIFTPRESGDYFIVVLANWSFETVETGSYVLEVNLVDDLTPDVPDNRETSATVEVDGEPYLDRITPALDRDWVAVELEADNTYHVVVEPYWENDLPLVGSDYQSHWTGWRGVHLGGVFNSRGQLLTGTGLYLYANGIVDHLDHALITPRTSGTYYIDVRAYDRQVGDYSVTVERVETVTASTIAAVADTAGTIVAGESQSISLGRFDGKWYKVDLAAGTTYQAVLKTSDFNGYAFIHGIYSASGIAVAWEANASATDMSAKRAKTSRVSFTPIVDGTYFIWVSRNWYGYYWGAAPKPKFTLSVSDTIETSVAPTVSQKLIQSLVDGGTVTLQPEVLTSGNVPVGGGQVWYNIELEGGESYWIAVRRDGALSPVEEGLLEPSSADPFIRAVYTEEGVSVYSRPLVLEGQTHNRDLDVRPVQTCRYYIAVVRPYPGPFTIRVTKTSDGHGNAPRCGVIDDAS